MQPEPHKWRGVSPLVGVGTMIADAKFAAIQASMIMTGSGLMVPQVNFRSMRATFVGAGLLSANGINPNMRGTLGGAGGMSVAASLMAPAEIGGGSLANGSGVTTSAPTLPSSRVNGDLMIGVLTTNSTGKTFSFSAGGTGWTIDNTFADGSACRFSRYVDGAEAAPTLQWTGAATAISQIMLFRGVAPSSAIGNTSQNNGNGTTLSASALTTTADYSYIYAWLSSVNSQTIPVPTGYADITSTATGNGSRRIAKQVVPTNGGSSSAVSVSITSAIWHCYLIELKRP